MAEEICCGGQKHREGILLDIEGVAGILRCSPRTVRRLTMSGRMPRPVKLGRLARWRAGELEDWISRGCPPCGARSPRKTRRSRAQ